MGGPSSISFERYVEGELPESEFPVMVDEIRRVLKDLGQVSQLGQSFAWTAGRAGAAPRNLEVSVSVRGGRTRIAVQEHLGMLIAQIYGGLGGGLGGGGVGPFIAAVMALHLPGSALGLLLPGWFVAVFTGARLLYRRQSWRRCRELELLADRLTALAAELIPRRRLGPVASPPA